VSKASDVAICGSAVLPNGIYFQPEEDLAMRAIVAAAKDAGIRREDIRGLIGLTPRPSATQHYMSSHLASRLRLEIEYIAEIEVAPAGLCNALRLGAAAIRDLGLPAVAIYGSARESAVPTGDYFDLRTSRISDASFNGPFGMGPIAWDALAAQELLSSGEATERDFAEISVRLRNSALQNPTAFFKKPITVDEVLASRMVASPIRLLMICPRTDGAGAIILAREDIARRAPGRAIAHHAQTIAHDGDNVVSEFAGRSFAEMPATRKAASKAWEQTGLGPNDIQVVEPWVPFSPMEIMVMRALGYGRDYNRQTAVSPSGGLVSRGHPAVPTGFYSLHEIVEQLRGEAGARQVKQARFGLTASEAGNFNTCVVDIFARHDGGTASA
jgi:acetyl-CoA C-acetyltransferase